MFGFVSESAFSCIDEDLGLCFGAKNERIVVDFFIPSESTSSSALVSGSSGSLRAFFSRSCFRYSFEVKYLEWFLSLRLCLFHSATVNGRSVLTPTLWLQTQRIQSPCLESTSVQHVSVKGSSVNNFSLELL